MAINIPCPLRSDVLICMRRGSKPILLSYKYEVGQSGNVGQSQKLNPLMTSYPGSSPYVLHYPAVVFSREQIDKNSNMFYVLRLYR